MSTATKNGVDKSGVNMNDVITLTARLAQIMAEEVDLLSEMKISKIDALQQEKLFITGALEAQRKIMDRHPELSESIPSQDKRDLQEVIDVFNTILEENNRKLLLAKEVNHKIVRAITDVVKEHTISKAYNGHGISGMSPFQTLSVTLDKTV